MSENPVIRAVLDRSALRSYARGHLHVGELLVDIADEGAAMGIPAAALLDAHAASVGDEHARALLRLLVTLPGIKVLDLDARTAPPAADVMPAAKGDIPRSHAVWAAKEHEAYYLTTEPTAVQGLLPPGQIHPIPGRDA
ncbi:hypothetical protein Asp14428_61610 [Actinoplanes sp. NBRC 14428]|uniref:Uncharacterized protein n=1 Tax=Pseudosporangium ferrugineum TaxID=439699 RepID=A0A2T0SCP2_9ACTN|nr:hypothetical protein [Pseudosporangium ferrugineum]PRY31187.1 hypothetical protein CLV70_10371 [Pseudosporangium ferrugineum]BCJ54686.1 hypothetical protein Asp14428_61610 [Actinoplanes sp. NBRC 14428]